MTKKITAILLSFIMVLTFMPTMAFANTPAPAASSKYTASIDFSDISETTSNASYEWSAPVSGWRTLTLKNFHMEISSGAINFGIRVPAKTIINIGGNSDILINVTGDATECKIIEALGDLKIQGSKALSLTSKNASADCTGISAVGDITITSGAINIKDATGNAIKAGAALIVGSDTTPATLTNTIYLKTLPNTWQTVATLKGLVTNAMLRQDNLASALVINFNGINISDNKVVEKELKLTYGDSHKLDVSSVQGNSLTFKTSNDKVATVATDGTVNAVGVGTATITMTDSRNSAVNDSIIVVVTAKALTSTMVSAIDAQDYTGANIYPTVTVKDGTKTLVKDTDYTLTYTNNKEIASKSSGKAPTVTVTGKGNYNGTVSVKFSIIKPVSIDIPEPAVGSKPEITIKDGTKTLAEGSDYTVTYANTDKIGYATATIKGKGTYAELNKVIEFKVLPKKSTVKKYTAGKKKATITWSKISGVDGYYLRLATDKKFTKNLKKVTVKNPNTTKSVVKSLKKGKRYYVRILAYKKVTHNGKVETFKANWSKVKRTGKIK